MQVRLAHLCFQVLLTLFALQVQKPTGEEGVEGGSKESTVSGMDLGLVPPSTTSSANPGGQAGLRSPRGGGRGARRSRSPTARGGRGGGWEGGQPLEGAGRASGGRGGGRGRGQAGKGSQPSLSTDDDTLVNTLQRDYIQRGKSRWLEKSYNFFISSGGRVLRDV